MLEIGKGNSQIREKEKIHQEQWNTKLAKDVNGESEGGEERAWKEMKREVSKTEQSGQPAIFLR